MTADRRCYTRRNFRHGTVDVFNDQWQQVNSLTDGSLPAGYAPFNAQVLDGHLFVTYAQQDEFKHDDVAGRAMASSTSSI